MHDLIRSFCTTKATVNQTLTVSNPFRQRQLKRWKDKQRKEERSDESVQEHHLACFEPCEFPHCMNSCRHSAGHADNRHVCLQHDFSVNDMSQQPTIPQVPIRTSLQNMVRNLQKVKSKAVTENSQSQGQNDSPLKKQ